MQGKKWHEVTDSGRKQSALPKCPVSSTVTLLIPGQGIAFLVFSILSFNTWEDQRDIKDRKAGWLADNKNESDCPVTSVG